ALPDLAADRMTPEAAAVPLIVAFTGIAAAVARSRLQAIVALGGTGFGIALLFAIYGAPDVAMTQVLVDTLTVLLLLSAFRFLPVAQHRASRMKRGVDIGIAVAFGALMTVLTWSVATIEGPGNLSEYFASVSVPEAHGRNVVNAILVDFRALDTLGEITVLAVATIGVIALLTP